MHKGSGGEARKTLSIALAQIAPVLGSVAVNIEKHRYYIELAKKEEVDIIVFPELSLTGYAIGNYPIDIATPLESSRLEPLLQSSKGITVIFGLVELGFAAQLHNSAVVAHDGEIQFVHRKLNLPNYGELEEGKHFATGRYVEIFDLYKPWYGGIMICSDAWNPALIHLAAVKGATILFVPICSARGTVMHEVYSNPEGWDLVSRFYSYAYGLPVIVVNRVGSEDRTLFFGRSFAYSPRGSLLHRCGETEELAICEVSYDQVVLARKALPTVRDSNLDLIVREINRSRNEIGYPRMVR